MSGGDVDCQAPRDRRRHPVGGAQAEIAGQIVALFAKQANRGLKFVDIAGIVRNNGSLWRCWYPGWEGAGGLASAGRRWVVRTPGSARLARESLLARRTSRPTDGNCSLANKGCRTPLPPDLAFGDGATLAIPTDHRSRIPAVRPAFAQQTRRFGATAIPLEESSDSVDFASESQMSWRIRVASHSVHPLSITGIATEHLSRLTKRPEHCSAIGTPTTAWHRL